MDIIEAVQQRRSIRAFKPDPVPQHILKEIVELAQRAPSWSNTQPWKLIIATGSVLEEIKQRCARLVDEPGKMDIDYPTVFPSPYAERRRDLGARVLEANNIAREDQERRKWWRVQGLQLFGAPCAIYICIDRAFHLQESRRNVWPLFDCGVIAESIMLLATKYGLGTIAEAVAIQHPQVLRAVLGIPESELIVIGIPIGYPDTAAPVNRFHSPRAPLDEIVRWCGF